MTQNFKGDSVEILMQAAGVTPFDRCSESLDQFYEDCFDTEDFLLMLYDAGRMPFSDRVPRAAFVKFIRTALENAQFTGSFESYLFLIRSIFGAAAEILFDIPAPGKLEVVINAAGAGLEFDFVGRDFVDPAFPEFQIATHDGDTLILRGISGIDSEAELNQLLSELIPAGIFPDIVLTFFVLSQWIAEDDIGDFYTVIDHLGNEVVFYETGA